MKMESAKKTITTTRRTPVSVSSPTATTLHKTRIKKTGVNYGRVSGVSDLVQEPQMSSKKHGQVVHPTKQLQATTTERITTASLIVTDGQSRGQVGDQLQQLEESCNLDSNDCEIMRSDVPVTSSPNIQLLNKTRSEPIEGGSSSDSGVKIVESENSDHLGLIDTATDFNISENQVIDCRPSSSKDTSEALSASEIDEVDVCETEESVKESSEEQKVVINANCDDMDIGKNEQTMLKGNNDKELIGMSECDGSGDQLIEQKRTEIKSKRILSPSINKVNSKVTPRPFSSTAGPSKPLPIGRKSVQTPPSSSSPLPTISGESSYVYDHSPRSYETHGKLQCLVDLVMWRDIARSAFIFGTGTFLIISSSYATDFNFSFISVASYLTLIYLAVMFLCKSFLKRGDEDDEGLPQNYVWGEDEAIWLAKIVLPYLNESLLKLRVLFSGDPAITMKVAIVLFILAKFGSYITLWKMVKLGFFGVFIFPKFCSSYSDQIMAYGKFCIERFQDFWTSCSHKKVLAFVVFSLVWNFSSVVARAWAVFMLFVTFRCYQQHSTSKENFIEEQIDLLNVQMGRHSKRLRCKVSKPLNQKKEKKSF